MIKDLLHALRQVLKNPGFAAVAVLTLALGIGANTIVFSVAKAVLFRPLGFDAPDRMMWVRMRNTQTGNIENRLSWRDIEDIRKSTRSFDSLATFGTGGATWEQGGRIEVLPELHATPTLAEVLRIRPVLGRMILPSDADATAGPVVLISHELWQARFNGATDVLGQSLRLNEKSHTVVGVLPPGLEFPLEGTPSAGLGNNTPSGRQSFWFPMMVEGEDRHSRGARMFLPVGRLKPGVTRDAARAEVLALGQRLAADHPETNRHWDFDLLPFRDQVLGRTRQAIPVLVAAVGAVLLICCVNLANLILARGVARQRELAIRLTLGAGRIRLARALVVESTLLSLLGGTIGIAMAEGAVHAIRTLAPANVPFIREATVDGAALLFTTGLSLLTAWVVGLVPVLRLSQLEAGESLRTGSRTSSGPEVRAWQRGLLVGQIAVVTVLLASSGLLLESFRRLMGQDLGYKPRSVITIDLNSSGVDSNEEVCRLYRSLYAQLSELFGVQAVGTISSTPLTGKWTFDERAQVFGQPVADADRPTLAATFVAFDYFQAMGIPLLEGRFFRNPELKDNGYGQFVIINQSAATVMFPGRSAVGGRFTVGSDQDGVLEVVGVVKDTRDVRLEEKPRPRFYRQYASGGAQVVIRSDMPSGALIPLVRDIVQKTDPRFVIHEIKPMTEILSSTVAERRFLMAMFTAYSVLALVIAAVGIFGVVSFQVAQRTTEFGVRLALGSLPGGLIRLVMSQAARWVLVGLVIGLFMSTATNRLLASQVFDLSPYNPMLLGTVSVLLLAVALVASWIPSRRAARVDPTMALRMD